MRAAANRSRSFAPYFDWRKLTELSRIVKRSRACGHTSNSNN